MKKRILTGMLAVLATAGMAFGQGLTVWTTFADQSLDWLQDEADAFTAAFGIPVNLVRFSVDELKQQVLLAAPQGEAADLFVGVPHDQLAEMAVGGVLADMSSYATDTYLSDLSEQARLAYTFTGKLFGLPMFVEGPALVVNTDLVSEVPATYEGMIELAQELTTDTTFGFMADLPNFYFAYGWIHTWGGYVFGRDASGSLNPADLGLANEGAVAGAQALKDLRFEYGLMPAGTDFNVANGLFIDGALGMIYTGPWSISQYGEAGVNVAVMPVPPLADGTPFSGFMGVQGVLMNQFSNQQVAAANFAKWLTRRDAQVSLAQETGRIPASGSALELVSDDPIVQGFGQALLSAEPMPNIPEMGTVWTPVGNALSVILESADSDVAGSLEAAQNEVAGN